MEKFNRFVNSKLNLNLANDYYWDEKDYRKIFLKPSKQKKNREHTRILQKTGRVPNSIPG